MPVDDAPPRALGPRERGHLAAHRRHGERARESLHQSRPRTRGENHVGRGVAGAPADDAHHPVAALVEPGHRLLQDHRAEALRVGEQCPHQLLGLERPLARGPERAGRLAEPGPARLHLVGIEPIATVTVLALPRAARPELARLSLVGRHPCDPLPGPADSPPHPFGKPVSRAATPGRDTPCAHGRGNR